MGKPVYERMHLFWLAAFLLAGGWCEDMFVLLVLPSFKEDHASVMLWACFVRNLAPLVFDAGFLAIACNDGNDLCFSSRCNMLTCFSPNSLLLGFYLRKRELAGLCGRVLSSSCPPLVLLLSFSCPLATLTTPGHTDGPPP